MSSASTFLHTNFVQLEQTDASFVRPLNSIWLDWLRLHLFGTFSKSKSWSEVNAKLKNRGFYLQQSGGYLWLRDCHSKVEICTSINLGFSPIELEMKFGALSN